MIRSVSFLNEAGCERKACVGILVQTRDDVGTFCLSEGRSIVGARGILSVSARFRECDPTYWLLRFTVTLESIQACLCCVAGLSENARKGLAAVMRYGFR